MVLITSLKISENLSKSLNNVVSTYRLSDTRTHTHAHTPQESTEVHDILLLKNQNLKTPPKARISCWLFSALL